MNNAMKDYAEMNVRGFTGDEINREYQRLQKIRDEWVTKDPNAFCILADRDVYEQAQIVQDLLQKHHTIRFKNDRRWSTEITAVTDIVYTSERPEILLRCRYLYSKKEFTPYLSTMLRDGTAFDFNLNKKVSEKIAEIDKQLADLEKQREAAAHKVSEAYQQELNKYSKIEQEAATGKKRLQLSDSAALLTAKKTKVTPLSTLLTPEEEKILTNWICDHVYSVRVYALADGQSGNALLNNYGSDLGFHLRESSYNAEGKCTSQDGISGEVYFTNTSDAPVALFKKACSKKRNNQLFKGDLHKRLCDKNLALYLIGQYAPFGFKASKKKLYQSIDKEALLATLNK